MFCNNVFQDTLLSSIDVNTNHKNFNQVYFDYLFINCKYIFISFSFNVLISCFSNILKSKKEKKKKK